MSSSPQLRRTELNSSAANRSRLNRNIHAAVWWGRWQKFSRINVMLESILIIIQMEQINRVTVKFYRCSSNIPCSVSQSFCWVTQRNSCLCSAAGRKLTASSTCRCSSSFQILPPALWQLFSPQTLNTSPFAPCRLEALGFTLTNMKLDF